jgi:hypothetical protein
MSDQALSHVGALQVVVKYENEARAQALYDSESVKARDIPLPVCQIAAEFAESVCADARPFDGKTHQAQSDWEHCNICEAMLCSSACGHKRLQCGHHICQACRVAHDEARCVACRRQVYECVLCWRHAVCERRRVVLPLCWTCGLVKAFSSPIQTCPKCQDFICSCCVALHMGRYHPTGKRKL